MIKILDAYTSKKDEINVKIYLQNLVHRYFKYKFTGIVKSCTVNISKLVISPTKLHLQ